MNPEHKLLKFVILPLVLLLLAYFVYGYFNPKPQWYSIGPFDDYEYDGDKAIGITNFQAFLHKNWDSDDLRYVVSVWHKGKSYFFNKQVKDDKEEINFQSRFRVASVSKVFTSIAMLQLVEKGKVSLDDPVEKYVPYKKNFKDQPTVGDLLLHTAGFDNNNTSFFYSRRSQKPTLKDFLFRQELVQAIEPQKVVDYTNTAFDIAGYIIEKVSGQRFEDYCRENVFLPLGMESTSFDEPASFVEGRDSKGEVVENYYVGGRPSGGLVSTSKDMSRFMECLMQSGSLDGTQVFSPKLMGMIFEKRLDMDPNMSVRKTPVFWIDKFGDVKSYAQMGKILGFSSHLIIIPGEVALFCASADESSGQHIAWSLAKTFFVEKYKTASVEMTLDDDKDPKPETKLDKPWLYTGRWINMFAWNRNNVAKIANAVAYNLNLTTQDSKLCIDDVQMEKVDDLTFRNGDWYVKFVRGDDGEIKYLQTGQDAHVKASWYMDSRVIITYAFLTSGIFLLTLLQFVFGVLMRRWDKEKSTKPEQLFRWSVFCISMFNIGFASVFAVILLKTDIYRLGFKPGWIWYVIFSLPLLATLLTPISIYSLIKSWKSEAFKTSAKINAILFVTVQSGFVIFLAFWNLLGFNF